MDTMMSIIYTVVIWAIGALVGWFISHAMGRSDRCQAIELDAKVKAYEKLVAESRLSGGQKEEKMEALRQNLASIQQEKTAAEVRLEEALKKIEDQRSFLERAEERLATTFQTLSDQLLKNNSRTFLELAEESLKKILKSPDEGDREKR